MDGTSQATVPCPEQARSGWEQQQSDVVLGSIGGVACWLCQGWSSCSSLSRNPSTVASHTWASSWSHAFVVWTRLMSAKCSRPAATGGHACAPLSSLNPQGPIRAWDRGEALNRHVLRAMDGWMDGQTAEFCDYRNCQIFWCSTCLLQLHRLCRGSTDGLHLSSHFKRTNRSHVLTYKNTVDPVSWAGKGCLDIHFIAIIIFDHFGHIILYLLNI